MKEHVMSTFTKNGKTYQIVTDRMSDGKLGRTLQVRGARGWSDVSSANHSASTRKTVICVDEIDAHLRRSV